MKRKAALTAGALILIAAVSHAQKIYSFKPVAAVPLKFEKTSVKVSDLPDIMEEKNAPLLKGPENESLKKEIRFYEEGSLPKGPDPATQKTYNSFTGSVAASAIQVLSNWDGINPGADPSDNTMAVGPSHVVQMVNGSGTPIRIFNKSTGAVLKNTSVKAITGTGNAGDPNIIYDQQADRYVMLVIKTISGGDIQICVSKTNDPTGQYYIYTMTTGGQFSNDFPDYPKLGVWGSSYFITTNASGPFIYALDRTSMLAGTTAKTAQKFTLSDFPGGGVQAASPASVIGSTNAPASSKPIIVRAFDDAWTSSTTDVDNLELYTMTIDWANANNSSISGPLKLNTAAFDSKICTGFNSSSCITQKSSSVKLDAIGSIVYDKVQYRNFGTYESIVCCVFADAGSNTGAIRWYELRKSGTGNWSIFQQGTYGPNDSQNRFMGSISQNSSGSIALGYNISGSTQFPGQRMTGRILGDAAGNMTATETIVKTGTVAKTSSNRYGDYNAMVCDPTDGSFWFTANYNPTSAPKTNIVHFKINAAAPISSSVLSLSSGKISVAPNPAQSYVDITYKSDKHEQVPMQLVNIEGNVFAEKMISCLTGDNKLKLDLSNVPTGHYLIKLYTSTGVVMEKLQVQK